MNSGQGGKVAFLHCCNIVTDDLVGGKGELSLLSV
jgi:hypothetical protein